ncbi:hypothetical protein HanPSC8_Chr09g0373601 [Helianthus annuus]|nr:hypothetical protein HanPSC8_Chr09g0373601 [Helianthus annuus]
MYVVYVACIAFSMEVLYVVLTFVFCEDFVLFINYCTFRILYRVLQD